MKMALRYFWILGLGTMLFFISCHTTQKTEKKLIKEPIKQDSANDFLFDKLKKNEFNFNWLSYKFSAELKLSESSKTFSGLINIRKDSIIWISISKLGIEVARILITEDSAKFMNRIESTYFTGDFSLINSFTNTVFDFNMLQALLIGNDFSYYENDKFKASYTNGQYKLSTLNRRKLKKHIKNEKENQKILVQDIWLEPGTFKINRVKVKEIKEKRSLDAFYSIYLAVNNQLFPTRVVFDVSVDKPFILTLEYNRVKVNEPQSIPFRIPTSYSRISSFNIGGEQ